MNKENMIIYQVFVRNHSQQGTFNEVVKDLNRIKSLGTDVLYLMPIHPIGEIKRKGTYGSPYSIKNYFAISKDLGTLEDFKNLVNKTHELGMKIILDMVFNHTSHDNPLYKEHPEYYYHNPDGKPGNHVGDWSDIIDLETKKEEVIEYLVSVLKYWIAQGVDGFRFDVASLINFKVFTKAREELGDDVLFLAESIDYDFVNYLHSMNMTSTRDDLLFPTFDLAYAYSWFRPLERHLKGYGNLQDFIDAYNEDFKLLNGKGLRVNFLGNHDCDRILNYVNKEQLHNLLLMIAKLKGALFIYAGEEYGISHKPELFKKDPIIWTKDEEVFSWYVCAIQYKKKQKRIIDQQMILIDGKVKLITKYEDHRIEEAIYAF